MPSLAESAARELPMSHWAYGGIALALFVILLVLVFQLDRH